MKQERTIRNSWYEAEAQGPTQEDYWQTPLMHMHKKNLPQNISKPNPPLHILCIITK